MKTKKQNQKMECIHCHQDLKNHSFIKINGAYVCLECLKQHYYFCDNCKNWHLKTSEKIKVGSQYYCGTCKNLGIIKVCEECGTWHLTTDLKKVFNKYYCKKHENIGLHLHFSRNYLTEIQIDLLVYFYSKHFETFKKLSGRINADSVQSWAQVNLNNVHIALLKDTTSEAEFLNLLKDFVRRGFGDRYYAINLTNSNTIEFRLGAGTTDYNKIKFWIDLHYTIYKNAKNINVNNLNDLDAWFSGRSDLLEAFKAA